MIIEHEVFSECPTYYHRYLQHVAGRNIKDSLQQSMTQTLRLLAGIEATDWDRRYAPGKWSLREVWVHVADCERMLATRALCIARRQSGTLAEFDQDEFVRWCHADRRSPKSIQHELEVVRRATIMLYQSLIEEDWTVAGKVGKLAFTPRALAGIIVGHECHHRDQTIHQYGCSGAA